MKVFSIYIKKQGGKILFYLLFSAVFFCLFFLYQIPLHAAVYAVFVGSAFGIAVLTFSVYKIPSEICPTGKSSKPERIFAGKLAKGRGRTGGRIRKACGAVV